MHIANSDLSFLKGGGEMGKLVREKDWSNTVLGDPAGWQPSLSITLGILLNSKFPMFLWWGPELICFYNDAYRPSLGVEGKHPDILGLPAKEAWTEIWDIINPLIDKVINEGEAIWFEDRLIPIYRNGKIEDVYWTFSYSPVPDESGKVAGVLVTCTETTEKVNTLKKVEESNARFLNNIMQAPVAMSVFRGKNHVVEIANEQMLSIWGKHIDEVMNKPIFEGLPEAKNQGLEAMLDHVYLSGEKFTANERAIDLPRNGKVETTYVNFVCDALKDANGTISGIIAIATEVTPQVTSRSKVEESEQKVRALVENAPFPIAVYVGKEMIVELANQSIIDIWGKGNDVIGKSFKTILPELDNQHVFEQIQKVLNTGESFHTKNTPLDLVIKGKLSTFYFNYSFTPLYDIAGNIYGVMNTGVDLTELNIAKKRIEESDKRFRNVVKQAPVGITILRGPEYIVEMANDEYLHLVDRKENEFVGQPLFDVLPEVKETVHALLDGVLFTGVPYHGNELPVPIERAGKKQICYFDFLYHPLKEEDGTITGIIVTVTEVTEKVEARKKTEQNEERLNIVIEASELGTWELNMKTMTPQYSQKYLEIIGGYTQNVELTHKQLLRHLHPDDMSIRENAFKTAIAEGVLHYEARVIWDDGSLHWMEGKGKVFYDADHKPEKMIGTIRDITDEKNHQQELEESEQRFRNLIMQSSVAIAILKGEAHFIEIANEVLLKAIWRKNEEEVIGKKIIDVFPELQEQKYAGLLDKVYSTGKKQTLKESYISISGNDGLKNFYIDFEFAPLFTGDNKVEGIKITVIDVTENVDARKKIEESEKRFRSLAETLPQLVWETDEKGNSLFTSGRWKEYTGVTPHGETEWKAVVHPDDFEENAKIWRQSIATGKVYQCDVRIKNKNGDYRWHRVIGEPVFGKENNIVKWVGAFTNIHTEKAFTQELEKQVAERTKELGDTNSELAKMNKELQTFAYISSHDLQEPLRKIQTFSTQIMQNESQHLSESVKDKFHRMQNAANRMQTLIDDLLIYSRTNTQERKFEKVYLNSLIDEVKEDLKEELQQKNVRIELDEMFEMNIIPFQFRQLLFNLINNSLKFHNPTEHPHIKIKAGIVEGPKLNIQKLAKELTYYHISVSDNGIGFEQQYSEKIFEVFQRLHGKKEYNGTGIGLSIVKRIVENHNGIITAKGELNKGATFDIYIPVI